MQPARALHDVLTDLVGDTDATGPAEVLAASGHGGLPDELVAEAVGSFADTAPIEVAEHLSPYVMANSPVPLADAPEVEPSGWLDAVTTAPGPDVDPTALLDGSTDPDGSHPDGLHPDAGQPGPDHGTELGDLDFGRGHGPDLQSSAVDSYDDPFDDLTPDPAGIDDLPAVPADHHDSLTPADDPADDGDLDADGNLDGDGF